MLVKRLDNLAGWLALARHVNVCCAAMRAAGLASARYRNGGSTGTVQMETSVGFSETNGDRNKPYDSQIFGARDRNT
jgi:hypothetical protein